MVFRAQHNFEFEVKPKQLFFEYRSAYIQVHHQDFSLSSYMAYLVFSKPIALRKPQYCLKYSVFLNPKEGFLKRKSNLYGQIEYHVQLPPK